MVAANAAVTASSPEAVAAGAALLRAGGNAVDAAVAAALASCVADPCNTGIGGFGGHMIVAPVGAAPVCIDFNAWAPLAAMKSYQRAAGVGAGASIIPNVVAGLSSALRAFGTKTWMQVLEPAIALADEGITSGSALRRALDQVRHEAFVRECFVFEETAQAGSSHVRQPVLARTLQNLATNGPQWFYEGPLAASGSRWLTEAGHETTHADWAGAVNAVSIAPACVLHCDDLSVFSSPLATSGSICMFATFAAGRTIASEMHIDSVVGICRWAELIASAWSYRFGGRDGNSINANEIEAWIERAASFETPVNIGANPGHTCHLNTVDKTGMLTATTLTHGKLWFGARWALPDSGVIMNYGSPALCDAAPKIIGQRSYGITNMNPTIVRRDDGSSVAIGSPGARRIASIVGMTLARHLFDQMHLQRAVEHGRFHAEGRRRATMEFERLPSGTEAQLRRAFETVEAEGPDDYYGPCTAIRRDGDGGLTLGLDDRWPGFGTLVT